MSPPRALQLRDALAHGYLATLLWDSWSHPETRTQATTWGLILHVIYFGSGSETARRLLHGPSFMMAHSVLAGWLQLCLLYTSPSPRDLSTSRMPSSA